MIFKIDTGARACYNFYKHKQKATSEINKRKFKNRILKFKRSKPNPKHGGWFVSNSGKPENTGLKFNSPIDVETFMDLEIDPNDKIFFQAGQIYNVGDFDITTNNNRLSRYGIGADPILRGTDDISGLTWTDEGGGIYSAPMAVEPNWVWISGVCAKMAETARITILTRPTDSSLTISHAAVSGYTTIVGSYIVAKDTKFSLSYRRTVTAYDGAGLVSFSDGIATANNVDLVFLNKIEFLTGDNEWAWESGVLYVKAAASPSTLTIRAGAYNYGFKTTGSLTVDNIEFAEYYQFGIRSDGGVLNVSDCNFHDFRDSGVLIETAVTGARIENNTFTRMGVNGFTIRPCTDSFFNGNTITNVGMQANYGWQTWFSGGTDFTPNVIASGIAYVRDKRDANADGSNCEFNDNRVTNTAYCGVSVSQGTDNFIIRNTISDYGHRFADGGGIYTFHYRPTDVAHANTEIAYNIVSDNNARAEIMGIYCDNRTIAAYVHHNTVYNITGATGWGLILNQSTSDHTVEDNNFYSCTYAVAFRVGDQNLFAAYPSNVNNQFNRNVIFAANQDQRCLFFNVISGSYASWNPFSGTGGADNNTYIKNAAPDAAFIADSDNQGNDLTLALLQTAYGEDAASVKLTKAADIIVNDTDAISNEDADSYYTDFAGTPVTTYTIAANYSRILLEVYNSNEFVYASSQYFNAGSTADIEDGTGAFSVSFWFKVAANPAATHLLFSHQDPTTSRGWNFAVLTGGQLSVSLINTVGTNRLAMQTVADVCDNTWKHVLVVVAAIRANCKIIINGVTDTSITANTLTATIATTGDLHIASNRDNTVFLDGLIDNIDYFNSDQTANSAVIYGGGRIQNFINYATPAPPIHQWRMGRANSLLDTGTSLTPLNLTPVNGPTASADVP